MDIKNEQKSKNCINITELITSDEVKQFVQIDQDVDYEIKLKLSSLLNVQNSNSSSLETDSLNINKEIIFSFNRNNLKSDINIRLILDCKSRVKLAITLHAPNGVVNCESKLDMKALVIDPDCEITFVPSLEIDEMNVAVDHKSTIGQPEQEWINYFYSRGLNKEETIDLIASTILV